MGRWFIISNFTAPAIIPLVLELGIGRGGDLQKLSFRNISSLTGIDISHKSLEECQNRYNESATPKRRLYNFPLTLIYGDFCTQSLTPLVRNRMHLITCQFAMHYAFATPSTANNFFQTLDTLLHPGYFFAATIPNAVGIVFVRTHSLNVFIASPVIRLINRHLDAFMETDFSA